MTTLHTKDFAVQGNKDSIQAAIDAAAAIGGQNEVIVNYACSPYEVTKTIDLRSNLRVVFEAGVHVENDKSFKPERFDPLVRCERVESVVIEAIGADFQFHSPYEEHNHVLALRGSKKIKVLGGSWQIGSDGIYIGPTFDNDWLGCSDIMLSNFFCEANGRNNLTVVSVEELRVANFRLDICGPSVPARGIDIEPSKPHDVLKDIIIGSGIISNSGRQALGIGLGKLTSESKPVSIRMRNLFIYGGCNEGAVVVKSERNSPMGWIDVQANVARDITTPYDASKLKSKSIGLRTEIVQ